MTMFVRKIFHKLKPTSEVTEQALLKTKSKIAMGNKVLVVNYCTRRDKTMLIHQFINKK